VTLQEFLYHTEGLRDFGVGDLFDRSVIGFCEEGCAASWTRPVLGGLRSGTDDEPSCDWAYVCGYPSHYATRIKRGKRVRRLLGAHTVSWNSLFTTEYVSACL
jgi:hypothetical protein